jgi:hypothetical protein
MPPPGTGRGADFGSVGHVHFNVEGVAAGDPGVVNTGGDALGNDLAEDGAWGEVALREVALGEDALGDGVTDDAADDRAVGDKTST